VSKYARNITNAKIMYVPTRASRSCDLSQQEQNANNLQAKKMTFPHFEEILAKKCEYERQGE